MLPDSYDGPVGCSQMVVGVTVAALVRLDLLPPPDGVLLGPGAVLGAPMPEASVHENSDARTREGDVGLPAKPGERVVDAEAKSLAVEERTQSGLGCRIAPALLLHPSERIRRRGWRRPAVGHGNECKSRRAEPSGVSSSLVGWS